MTLPKALHGAFHCFNTALLREHGITVSGKMYLRLLERAELSEQFPLKDHRKVVRLHFDQRHIDAVYDPTGDGALISVLPRLKK